MSHCQVVLNLDNYRDYRRAGHHLGVQHHPSTPEPSITIIPPGCSPAFPSPIHPRQHVQRRWLRATVTDGFSRPTCGEHSEFPTRPPRQVLKKRSLTAPAPSAAEALRMIGCLPRRSTRHWKNSTSRDPRCMPTCVSSWTAPSRYVRRQKKFHSARGC